MPAPLPCLAGGRAANESLRNFYLERNFDEPNILSWRDENPPMLLQGSPEFIEGLGMNGFFKTQRMAESLFALQSGHIEGFFNLPQRNQG